jgi:hypothetical protein
VRAWWRKTRTWTAWVRIGGGNGEKESGMFMGPGDEAIIRQPTPDEARTMKLDAGQPVIEITRADGSVDVTTGRVRTSDAAEQQGGKASGIRQRLRRSGGGGGGRRIRLPIRKRVRLRAKLAVAELRTEAAIALVESIVDAVEDYRLRKVVVGDVVTRWQELDAAVQEKYRREGTDVTPLQRFVWDYVDRVGAAAFVGIPEDRAMTEEEVEETLRQGWSRHIAEVRGKRQGGLQS